MKMMMPTSSDLLRKHRMQILLLTLLTLLVLLPGSGVSDNRVKLTTGFIAAVGVEVDENGHPMLAEYDSDGRFVADVGHLGLGELEDVNLYPAASWRAFELFHQNLQSSNPIGTQGATLMSAETYSSRPFMTRGVSPVLVRKPELFPGTKSVYVIAEDRMLNSEPAKAGFILAEYPVALHEGSVAADAVTLLLNPKGEIVRTSNYDISFKAAVYKEGGRYANTAEERLWLPLPNVRVDAGDRDMNLFPGGQTVSGADGRYTMSYAMPSCPGFSYTLDIPIIATLDIENFNPKNDSGSLGFMTASRNASKTCVGYGDTFIGASFGALNAQINARAIVATLSVPLYNHDIRFSTMQLNAIGTMPGVRMTDNTVYTEDSAVSKLETGEYDFDFNLDGEPDTVVLNPDDDSKVDIYYSPNPPTNEAGERNPPDFTRLADHVLADQLAHQGLLSEISQEDLEDTDIYIYRRSTGQLLGTIEGLAGRQIDDGSGQNPDDDGPLQAGNVSNPKGRTIYRGVHTEEESGTDIATFGFTSFLVGAISDDFKSRFDNYRLREKTNRRPWLPTEGAAGGFTSDNTPDGLRPGEVIQIIAINRATGYIGSQNIFTQPSGVTLNPPSPILMWPPNLKIIASREFEDFNELSRTSDQKINIIGSEGAGLTSDTYVKIQTVWLAQNGDVLPDDLPGYTGRLAISTGSATRDFSANFEIKPGYQTQVVQLNNAADLTTEHFYVQVVGEHFDGNPIFESPGAGEGKLQTRPKKYVPLLVPLFDEENTRQAEEALALARLEGIENLPDQVDPTYHWVYRPEMQFSVFDLQRPRLRYTDPSGILQLIDLNMSASYPIDELLNSNPEFVFLLYDLSGPQNNRLASFGEDLQLVFSIGAEEELATIAADGPLSFDEITHLDSLASEDFLTIRLYTNNDSANTLWEWAFLRFDINIDSDNNNGFAGPDQNSIEDEIEFVINDSETPGKVLVTAIRDSDSVIGDDQKPDFADYIVIGGDAHETQFTPIVLRLTESEDEAANIKLQFEYQASDPNLVQRFGDEESTGFQYIPAPGMLRIWAKMAKDVRQPKSVMENGDWVSPDTPIPLNKLPGLIDKSLLLYVETVGLSQKPGDHVIKITQIKSE